MDIDLNEKLKSYRRNTEEHLRDPERVKPFLDRRQAIKFYKIIW